MASLTAVVNSVMRTLRNPSCGLFKRCLTNSLSSCAACATVGFFMAGPLPLIGWWNFHSGQGAPAAFCAQEASHG